MKKCLLILALVVAAHASDTLTIYEVDNATQTNRPITFGRVFVQGEFPGDGSTNCARPVVGGTPIAAGSWQNDAKNYWPDHSLKFAVVSLIKTLSASGSIVVSFQAGTCDNTGFLTQAQMTGFNSGNWDAQHVVTPLALAAVTKSAKTMVGLTDPGANSYGDCLNDYWLKGPVVTGVIVQDCTSASASDFGWTWNGTTMATPVTGNSATASMHPMFICYFYPNINAVYVEAIIEIPWSGRRQNQDVALAFKGGTGPTTIYSKSTFEMINGTRARKTFWSNSDGSSTAKGPGQIRIDHNFTYLKSTFAFPNYDSGVSVSPDSNPAGGCASCTSWTTWSSTDKGDIGGTGGISSFTQDYSSNSEGAPLQREDLAYLYNMGTCGTANSACAKAWQMLTGESGANDTTIGAGNVTAGGGAWYMIGNVPFHMRESRTVATGAITANNWFYCPTLAAKDTAGNSTTCGSGTGNATGKSFSRHTHSADIHGFNFASDPIATVGTMTLGGWASGGCDHWWNLFYTPYLLTGSPYYLEEQYEAASYCLDNINPGNAGGEYSGNAFFAYMNPAGGTLRIFGWGLQEVGRAAFIAPDGTPEASYYTAQLNSNLEVMEGILGNTGTTLTPADTTCSAGSVNNYDYRSANRWNWGRCTMISNCTNTGSGSCTTIPIALHEIAEGVCPINGGSDPGNELDNTVADSWIINWQYNAIGLVLSEFRDAGFSQVSNMQVETHRQLEEKVKDSTYNPYLVGAAFDGMRVVGGTCTNNVSTSAFISSYATLKSSNAGKAVTSFANVGNSYLPFACFDHGYSVVARAAASFLQYYNTSSSDANCPSGTCTASDTWSWLNTNVPYFNNASWQSLGAGAGCTVGGTDEQIKWALAPRSGAAPVSGVITIVGGITFKGGTIIK